jgi:hypothetical protein
MWSALPLDRVFSVKTFVSASALLGLKDVVVFLRGERPELATELDRAVVIERNFTVVAAALRSVDGVIAADSLPAHLAGFFGKVVPVRSREPLLASPQRVRSRPMVATL